MAKLNSNQLAVSGELSRGIRMRKLVQVQDEEKDKEEDEGEEQQVSPCA